ncbi:MAG: DUF378 domain-containing protein [Candidatus Woesebacteria bacterium]|nr:MAG: DUF378 domain-containing protein [Candidatus Woesebacteria bacterium]
MNTLDYITWILVVVGAINWGLVGAFKYNLVEMVFGVGMITQWVYILVGLSGVYAFYKMFTMKK